MADISKEIQAFRDAIYGEEVRGSMISLAEKINGEVSTNTEAATTAAVKANDAAQKANDAANDTNGVISLASNAASSANAAAADAEAVKNDILERLAAGEFKGERGEIGETGPKGESGVMASTAGMFSLYLDPGTGNLYAEYPDGSAPPTFEYDQATGNLYYVTDNGGES